jgi:diadenosine tetraphosphate (Ap4A) HIT family hydrolase/5-methylcytosine-specific restriction endonuclease McrA
MSQVYQPVMLMELLKNKGEASVSQIAQAILDKDPTQIEYFSEIVKNMVGKVLTKNRGITEKTGNTYSLIDASELSTEQVNELLELCKSKIDEFEAKRGDAVWQHRKRGHRPISGSVRYEVLSRAKFKCELCGISADEKNIEVDHIFPKSLGGKDDISNYQALCYSCNAAKRNTDDTDFRVFKSMYEERVEKCLFCDVQTIDRKRIIAENSLAYAIRDGFPVTEGHTLFIPKRHTIDYFGLVPAEVSAINQLMEAQKAFLLETDPTIGGFNIGMNCGEIAGQSVWHCHVHLIPRRKGDVEFPKGGVRHVIPYKGNYEDLR